MMHINPSPGAASLIEPAPIIPFDYEATLLFDGVCVLCSGAIGFVLRNEQKPTIRFVAVQSNEGKAIAIAHGIDPHKPDSFLFIEGEKALSKSDGVIALARHLKGPARIVLLGKYVPQKLRNWLYDRVAQNRYSLFGRTNTCMLPEPATKRRFVLPTESGL